MPADPRRVKELFVAALDLDPHGRAAFLDRECGDDAELRQRLDALLAAHDHPESALERPLAANPETHTFDADPPTDAWPGPADASGTVLAGKYRLTERIGEGGMGSVWLAHQSEPVKRKVAVKLIKAGMDSKAVLARFEAERQALAMMDHPNIAKVFDGGLHEHRPFFVMELVKGVPITEYCDARKLTPKERLELFVPACHAIQHAHQKGIIHRDIKPSNVLVALYDDRPVVKVIDFGVAKATGGTLTEATMDTGFGGVVGTPQYMSPEQATFNNLDIDTRSDVYALGVLLYELLVGSPPFGSAELKARGLLEMLRVVREEEPPRPSHKLSTADTLPSLAAVRGTEPKALTGLLRSELDWIVMKALEKERSRRYETANGFAADVLRYLAGEPVHAHPPSAGYRLKKFVRKNRGPVIAATLVLAALVAGVVGTTLGLVEARRQEGIAREQEAEAKRQEGIARDEAAAKELARAAEAERAEGERKARLEEERQRKFAQAIADFVQNDFLALTSIEGQDRFEGAGLDRNATLAGLLRRAAEKLNARKDLEPLIEAELRWIVGVNLRGIGEFTQALPHLERCVQLRTEALGRTHTRTLVSMNSLAVAYAAAGRSDRGRELAEEALRLLKERHGSDHPFTIGFTSNLAGNYQDEGRFDLAAPLHEEAYRLAAKHLGPNDEHTLTCMGSLGRCYTEMGTLDLALPLLKDTLRLCKTHLGEDHRNTAVSLSLLGFYYRKTEQFELAAPLFEQAMKLSRAKLGPEHPHTILYQAQLGSCLRNPDDIDRGIEYLEEAFRLAEATYGRDHPQTLNVKSSLGDAYLKVNKTNQAFKLIEEALADSKKRYGDDHPDTLAIMAKLAGAYLTTRWPDRAVDLFQTVVDRRTKRLGADHPDTLSSQHNLAVCHWMMGNLDKSVPLFEDLLKRRQKIFGRDHARTQMAVANLGVNYKDTGRPKEALPLLEEAYRTSRTDASLRWVAPHLFEMYAEVDRRPEALELLPEVLESARKALPKNSPPLASGLAQISLNLMKVKAFKEVEPLLRECLTLREKYQPEEWTTFNTHSLLGGSLLGQKKYAEAEPLLLKGYEGMKEREKAIPKVPQTATRIPEALDRLIALYAALEKPEEVKKWRAERAKYPPPVAPPPREKR